MMKWEAGEERQDVSNGMIFFGFLALLILLALILGGCGLVKFEYGELAQPPPQGNFRLLIDCPTCVIERAGQAPLEVFLKLKGDGDGPALFDYGDGDRSWAGLNETVRHVYLTPGRYFGTATYGDTVFPFDITALPPTVSALWEPWTVGRLCDVRRVLLDDPLEWKLTSPVMSYRIEIRVKVDLDAFRYQDLTPYYLQNEDNALKVKPQVGIHTYTHRINLAFERGPQGLPWPLTLECIQGIDKEELKPIWQL